MSNLHRIQWIDARLRAEQYPNCALIAGEFEISVRQAARDVEYLKYSLGAPVEYSFARRGFYYAKKTFALPALFLDEEERSALHYLADRYRSAGGEATARLAALFDKLDAGPGATRPKPGADVPVYIVKAGLVRTYGILKEAAASRRKVRIAYADQTGRSSERVIRPYAVFIKDRADYVHAYCEERRAERDFRLDRIASLEKLGEGFILPPGFDPSLYHSGYRFNFRLPYRALVRFAGEPPAEAGLAFEAAEDGCLAAGFTDSDAFLRRLLSGGAVFTIVSPRWLRGKCAALLRELYERHADHDSADVKK